MSIGGGAMKVVLALSVAALVLGATEVFINERAEYGKQIVATVSRQLVREFGRGFAEKNLRRMMQFSEAFPEEAISGSFSPYLSPLNASSMPRCVVSKGGAFEPCGNVSTRRFTNERCFLSSRKSCETGAGGTSRSK